MNPERGVRREVVAMSTIGPTERAAADLLAAAVEELLDPMTIMAPVHDASGALTDFEYLYLNRAGYESLGVAEGIEVVGSRMLARRPDLSTTLFRTYADVLATGVPNESTLVEPDTGSAWGQRTFVVRVVRIGEHLAITWNDISEKAATAERLARSEEHYRLLADNSSDVVVRESPDGTIEWVSASVKRALGWEPEDLVGLRFEDLVHADEMVQATGTLADPDAAVRFECRIRGCSGSYRWFSVNLSPIRGEHGLIARVAAWRDVDHEVEIRHRAAMREAEYRLLAENATDLVMRLSADGRITWVSPSVRSSLGYRIDELLDRPCPELIHPDDVHEFLVGLGVGAAEPGRVAARLRHADGSYEWFAAVITRVQDVEGHQFGHVMGLRSTDAEVTAIQAMADSERRFRTAMASAPGGMAVVGLDRRFIEVNDALAGMVGRERAWLLEHGIADILHEQDDPTDYALRRRIMAGLIDSATKECRLARPDGSLVWVDHAIGMLRNERREAMGYVSQFVDITEARRTREELEYMASHDSLTQLANRHALVRTMTQMLAHAPRGGLAQGLLFLDLDGLKAVNDKFGHTAGDELLVHVAERIRGAVRTEDHVARLGGDEFVVLLPGVGGLPDVMAIGDKIRESVGRAIPVADVDVQVTVSVGATLAESGEQPEVVIDRADRALYQAKAAGRDTTIGVEPDARHS